MGKETALPKNIRQIGDIQGKEKICIEDYVMTYIHKKEPQEEKGVLGIFLGERQETEEADYTFVRGILEIPQEEEEEKLRECFEKERSGYFPGWEVMGCCVIGVYPTKRLELLTAVVPEAERMIYHLQEQEENIYLKDQGNYRKMKGYLVFYEQNQKMQDYLAEIFGKDSVEKESTPDKAIKSFRQKVKEKGEQRSHSLLKLASSFFVVTVLAIGAIVVNRIDEIRTVSSDNGQNNAAADSTAASSQSRAANTVVQYTAQNTAQNTVSTGEAAAQNTASAGENTVQGAAFTGETTDQNTEATGGTTVQSAASAGGATVQNAASAGENTVQSAAAAEGSTAQGTSGTGNLAQDAGASDGEAPAQSAGTDNDSSSWLAGADSFWEDTAGEDGLEAETGASSAGAGDDSAQDTAQSETSEAVSRQTQAAYVIKAGDTLANICKKYYGSMERLEEICEANNISDANLILPGQKIVLP